VVYGDKANGDIYVAKNLNEFLELYLKGNTLKDINGWTKKANTN